jgi:hypothetical protein
MTNISPRLVELYSLSMELQAEQPVVLEGHGRRAGLAKLWQLAWQLG